MAARSIIRKQGRIADYLLEEASICCATIPWLSDTKRAAPSTKRLPRPWGFYASRSARFFASVRANGLSRGQSPIKPLNTPRLLAEKLGKAASVVDVETLPSEEAIQNAMQICEELSRTLSEPQDQESSSPNSTNGPTLNLLSLEQEQGEIIKHSQPTAQPPKLIDSNLGNAISTTAYKIMADPKVYITSQLLSTYVSTQIRLRRPQSFPEIFDMYRSKLVPRPGSFPIQYRKQNPDHPASAIPLPIAQNALSAAIEAKELQLCMDIVDATVCNRAHLRRRCLRYLTLPGIAVAATPFAVYEISSRIADWQDQMDKPYAIAFCFTAIMAYVYFTSLLGWVAIGTYNDHHDRITWQPGTQLRFRWVREDERAMVDRIALAWGFRDRKKRGEEEGEDWEWLREWSGRRALVLDAVELMEGMQ